jgi:UDP-3-O-[3-hydroxymyristoyl] N-acetylglucosamine deacetylase/3-hydroxyacyl-[acyl-carrier-protein] dehydratase
MTALQQTIGSEVEISGIGIHTGQNSVVRLKPAPENSGIKFIRVDLPGKPHVQADIAFVTGVKRGTTLENGEARVQTVEHLMATLFCLGIDNLDVEINSDELPVGDGSADNYTRKIMEAGIIRQKSEKKFFSPRKVITYSNADTELMIFPFDRLSISSVIHYKDGSLPSQYYEIDVDSESYISEIASSRTYTFENEIEHIKQWGLGKGGNLENTIVVGDNGEATNTELRYKDEFVRHKVLDLLGDISLIGINLRAKIVAIRSGHASNIELTRKLRVHQEETATDLILDIKDLLNILPHRYPFLMVDRIEMNKEKLIARGFKNVTADEPFFKGHYPGNPVFPQSLIIEFMGQSSAILLLSKPELNDKLAYFIIIESAEFFSEVHPMDTLSSRVELVRSRARGAKVKGEAFVGDRKVAKAEFIVALVDQ